MLRKYIFKVVLVALLLMSLTISVNADSSVYADSMASGSNKTETDGSEINKMRITLLERALEPKEPYAAVKAWAEGVKTRNGALQYAVMSPKLKDLNYDGFVELGWVTGVSSPWVESYEIVEKYRLNDDIYRYLVKFIYTDSTKSCFYESKYVTINNFDGSWLVSNIEVVDIKGKITKLTINKDKKTESFFVEAEPAEICNYDKATVIIGKETKIYEGYTNNELSINELKKGTNVSVTFTDDPRIMIYPVSAEARIIRILGDDLKDESEPDSTLSDSIVYENTKYGFNFVLPDGWTDFSIVAEKWEGMPAGYSAGDEAAETGDIINIRHPLWTAENPRQDIPIMVFSIDQWNSLEKGSFHIGAAPVGPTEIGRNSKYVFALPARYNYEFPTGFEEVEKILENNPLKPSENIADTKADTVCEQA